MNNADQIQDRDAGFTRVMDPRAARRQLHVSAAVAAIFGLAAAVMLTTAQVPASAPANQQVKMTVQAPQMVHVQQASVKAQPGG